ncbi:MAG: response regulator transcription factor [Cytophagaceae bacterium]|nr:response regulator transcription factor [Gemmatimonadaceae bacterium]
MTSILIIEDNRDLAYGLRNNLEIEGYDVEVAADGVTGFAMAKQHRPDLVVLDLMIPGMDGYQVLRHMRKDGLDQPVLILTARGEETDKVTGFRLGADDYVTKPFGVLELLARIEALLRRRPREVVNDAVRERFGDVEIDRASHSVTRNGARVNLAPLEYQLLVALMDRKGAVVSRLALMRDVWGHQASVVSRTVDTHILELRKKLEADPANPQHVLTVRKAGYRLQV